MSIYKRGGVYWYKFQWKGKLVRESTKQGNDKVARQMEAAHRTSLAKGEVGLRKRRLCRHLSNFAKDGSSRGSSQQPQRKLGSTFTVWGCEQSRVVGHWQV